MMRLIPIEPAISPTRWQEARAHVLNVYLFDAFPIGRHHLVFETIDPRDFRMQTRERSYLLRKWDHLISLERETAGTCRYRDQVEIDAGILSPLVWLWALWFYRHRQSRWRMLARHLSVPLDRHGRPHPELARDAALR